MPIPSFGGLGPYPEFQDVVNKVNQLVNELRNLLLNLDSLNVVSVTADHVDAGTLDAGKVTVKVDYGTGASITLDGNGMTIFDGTKSTFNVNTSGHVTMTSATVQSASGYPKVIMDPSGNLLGAYTDALNYLTLIPNDEGSPTIFTVAGGNSDMFFKSITGIGVLLASIQGDITFQAFGGDINLNPGNQVRVSNWSRHYSDGAGKTLQQELNEIWSAISALSSPSP